MNLEIDLKRDQFVNNIRMEQRERKKREIREKFNQMTFAANLSQTYKE